MDRYRDDETAIRGLVRPEAVHRDVYTSPELFDLEMERLWRNTWIYVGHDSQVPQVGDFYTTQIGREPVIMVRDQQGKVNVLLNRCSHKGAKLSSAPSGNCGGMLRCPYHGWIFRLDGSLRTVPVKSGYEGSGFDNDRAAAGLTPVAGVENYRGFVFARLQPGGIGFKEFFGDSLSSIDNMADRSPEGRLEIAGGVLRYMHDCNWKIFIENLNDTAHPMVAHESSAGTARDLWREVPPDTPKPMVVEQFLPFVAGYEFMDGMGVRIFDNGHSYTGVNFSIHSAYSGVSEYENRMYAAYGEERARAILKEARHNTVYYPSLTIKGAIQAIRVVRPIAHNLTLLESWTFRLAGAPDDLLKRTVMYTRLINAPTSVVGHDDLHCYRSIQQGLAANGNDWISLHRKYQAGQPPAAPGVYQGLDEVSMRGQFQAWKRYMTEDSVRGGRP